MDYTKLTRAQRYRLRQKGVPVPFMKMGVAKGYKQTPEHVEKRKRFGKEHHHWKGDAVTIRGGRTRALRIYRNIGPCVSCGSKRSERHHKDGNTANNEPGNIIILCRRCHMREDKRIEAFKQLARKNQPRALAARWGKVVLSG